VQQICDQLGISKPTLYTYFKHRGVKLITNQQDRVNTGRYLHRDQTLHIYGEGALAMNDDVSDIQQHYNEDPVQEYERLSRHQLEWEMTWRYLDHYLPRQGPILEIGAGPGPYTVELAKRGYQVTAVDFSEALLSLAQREVAARGLAAQVEFVLADVRDLSGLQRADYSAALVMGPLYHLVYEEERRLALAQVHEHLRTGGLIVSAFISRLGILGDLIRNLPDWILAETKVDAFLKQGRRPDGWPKGGFRGYFARVEEIAPLHEVVGFSTLVLAGVEPAISADDESYNRLQGEERRAWLDLLYAVSAEPAIVGASRHLLYVGEKR
jgi:S-adenosylmethionine-dependent methyltransferase